LSILIAKSNVSIHSPGPNSFSVSGLNQRIIFAVTGGTLEISGIKLHNGNASQSSGGAVNQVTGSDVFLFNSLLADNQAVGPGGGVVNTGGRSWISYSSLKSNSTPQRGGAIFSGTTGYVRIRNSTFEDNTTGDIGGGVHNVGVLFLENSTFTGNFARV